MFTITHIIKFEDGHEFPADHVLHKIFQELLFIKNQNVKIMGKLEDFQGALDKIDAATTKIGTAVTSVSTSVQRVSDKITALEDAIKNAGLPADQEDALLAHTQGTADTLDQAAGVLDTAATALNAVGQDVTNPTPEPLPEPLPEPPADGTV
jgi:DNA anti-recombination protein RmuC